MRFFGFFRIFRRFSHLTPTSSNVEQSEIPKGVYPPQEGRGGPLADSLPPFSHKKSPMGNLLSLMGYQPQNKFFSPSVAWRPPIEEYTISHPKNIVNPQITIKSPHVPLFTLRPLRNLRTA